MPFLVGCLALGFPRLAVLLVWLFGDGYLMRALHSGVWLVLGFLFMPLTTLAFAYATNSLPPQGSIPDLGWVLVGVAALLDLGIFGSGRIRRRSKPRE
jgi:hypothetical protein